MASERLGIIMHGVTGRMGLNQHLVRSIVAIRNAGGVELPNGNRVMPDPILVERNGHHYVDGMSGAPQAEQDAFVAAHPDLYTQATNGTVRVAIHEGAVSLTSLNVPGLGVGPMPDFAAMR